MRTSNARAAGTACIGPILLALFGNGCAISLHSASDLSPFESEAYPVLMDQLTKLASYVPVQDRDFICVHVIDADGKMRTLKGTLLIDALRRAMPVDAQIEVIDAASCIKDPDGDSMTSKGEPASNLFARKIRSDERGNWVSGFSSSVAGQWTYYKVDVRNGEPAATATVTVNWD